MATLPGGSYDDYLTGTAQADVIFGGAGNDILMGEGGDDQLFGGAGSDMLFGGEGNDLLDGGAGNDVLFGGEGNDTLNGGLGDVLGATPPAGGDALQDGTAAVGIGAQRLGVVRLDIARGDGVDVDVARRGNGGEEKQLTCRG